MPVSIVVPQLGESVAEGTVSKWLKAVGERVRKEEPLVEIQTDKINVEIPSPAEGTLEQILVPEGTTVLVGTEIGVLGSAAGNGGSARPAVAPQAAAPSTTGIPAATASAGAPAGPGAPAAPPTRTQPAPAAPEPVTASVAYEAETPEDGHGTLENARNLSPAVRRLMREHNLEFGELTRVHGSGIAGRVTRDDLLDYLKSRSPGAAPAASPSVAMPPVAVPAAPGRVAAAPATPPAPIPGFAAAPAPSAAGAREDVVPFSKVRKLIAENMVRAKQTAAHTHCFDEADMGAIVAFKKEWGPKLEAQGVKLTYMPFFIKASTLALKEFPWVNGEVRGDAMVVKRYYNIGIAVGRDDKGLIVPNLKNCDQKNLAQLAAEVNDLAARARADRLKPDEIQGGTFSITNAGVYGAINSSPVINVPEVAILGVHKIVERPVVRDGGIVARPMMNASIGFDHRVVDGELAVKFLRRICELLERPEMLWFYA
jgi:pyruvate/2-oxoglutarate dehydrogenase complex dihydrolipoamide acyltransferase (E2) component